MNIELINEKILEVYQYCGVTSFPIDCSRIMDIYKIPTHKYSQQTPTKQAHCYMVSDDAFTLRRQVYYNDRMHQGRIRFSLMHELGHILLGHGQAPSSDMEREANYFSGHLLAPRLAIHYSHCQNEEDVVKVFQISHECALYSFQDYRRWSRRSLHRPMAAVDKALYQHFYDNGSGQFVYHRSHCYLCGETALNSKDGLCSTCRRSFRLDRGQAAKQYEAWTADGEIQRD